MRDLYTEFQSEPATTNSQAIWDKFTSRFRKGKTNTFLLEAQVLKTVFPGVGVEEWAVRVIQGMYTDVKSRVSVNGQYSKKFRVGVGVHQGSVAPVPYWCAIGASVCWRPCCKGRLTWRMHCKVEGMERGYGMQGTESQHEEDKAHGLGTGDRGLTFFATLEHSPVQSVGLVLVWTLSSARSACIGCTRSAVVLEEDWPRIQTLFVQDAVIRRDRLTIDLSHSSAPARPFLGGTPPCLGNSTPRPF